MDSKYSPILQARVKPIAGQRFERWTLLSRVPGLGNKWNVRCDCGVERAVAEHSILSARSRSCGCLTREAARAAGDRTRTHGMTRTTTHNVWAGMLRRCNSPTAKDYPRYGGRGITVCERWLKFENFYADMGARPADRSIDRINNDGNYEPGNCRWATASEQNLNTRRQRKEPACPHA